MTDTGELERLLTEAGIHKGMASAQNSSTNNRLNALRLVAFKTNDPADRLAYFEALNLAFQRGDLIACDIVMPTAAEVVRLRELLLWAHDTLYEINPSNYDHDDVCRLNDASVDVILGIAQTLGDQNGTETEGKG